VIHLKHTILNKRLLLIIAICFACCSVHAQTSSLNQNNQKDKVKVDVYPNPTSDQITIDLSKTKVVKPVIEIRSIIGSMMRIRLEKTGIKKYKVDVSQFPKGYYLVMVREDRQKFQETIRFSKK